MTGQIQCDHGQPALETEADQVAIQTHVIEVAMQNESRAHRFTRLDEVHRHALAIHVMPAHAVLGRMTFSKRNAVVLQVRSGAWTRGTCGVRESR